LNAGDHENEKKPQDKIKLIITSLKAYRGTVGPTTREITKPSSKEWECGVLKSRGKSSANMSGRTDLAGTKAKEDQSKGGQEPKSNYEKNKKMWDGHCALGGGKNSMAGGPELNRGQWYSCPALE